MIDEEGKIKFCNEFSIKFLEEIEKFCFINGLTINENIDILINSTAQIESRVIDGISQSISNSRHRKSFEKEVRKKIRNVADEMFNHIKSKEDYI